jgi:hypothetical protein
MEIWLKNLKEDTKDMSTSVQDLERLQTNGTPDSDFRILEYPLDLCDQSVKASIIYIYNTI